MNWYEKILSGTIKRSTSDKSVPEGVWAKCDNCGATLYRAELEAQHRVCPKCNHHMRLSARKRLDLFLDKENRQELDAHLRPTDTLKFRDSKRYTDRISAARKMSGEEEALISMQGFVQNVPVVAVAFAFDYMGGSMGSVVGEKFVRAANRALDSQSALVSFSASGGARMQESMLSLMQMAKTSAVLKRLQTHRIPFISVLTDPTMGGVSASFAMLGDVIIAEPNALIGFAGQRVIEQTVRETLPEGFQRSEFLLEHGAIDMIVERKELSTTIANILTILQKKGDAAQF